MKTSRVCKTAPVIAILFGSIFHADPASAEGCPTPNFAAARTFNVGAEGRPFCVAVGDFNGDDQLDLVVANYGCPACPSPVSGSVSILLGHGDGAFQSVDKYDAGPNPQAVVVGDFNGDGKPDLAVANNGSTNVAVLLGNGDATFQTAISYGVGGTPPPPFAATGVLAIGDFNRDGKVDLAVANSGGVSVLSGKGDGTFQNAVNYATGGSASSVVVGDFNGDGKPDLAVNNGGGVSVLLGNGDGTFLAAVNYGTGRATSSVVAGDFNGDGKTDLAVATATTPSSSDNVSVLLGNGDGTFQAAVHYVVGSFPYSVTAGDFNGDGKADLAVATDVGISLLLGNGDGTFQAAVNYVAGPSPLSSAAVGDFNGDGKPDLALANQINVSILLGGSNGAFEAVAVYSAGTSTHSVAVGDFNGDGISDLAVANSGLGNMPGGNVSMLLGKRDGTFQTLVSYSAGSKPVAVTVADFNGDGKPDLAVANAGVFPDYKDSSVSLLLGNGDGTLQTAVNYTVGTNPGSVVAGDFNGDGKPDLAVANHGSDQSPGPTGNVSVLLGKGDGTFQATVNYSAGSRLGSVATGDFNGDGRADLAVANSSSTNVSILLGNGDGSFQAAVNYSAGSDPLSVAVGDFNADGQLDLAVANGGLPDNNFADSCVSVLLGNGDGTFRTAIHYGTGTDSDFVVTADFNGDGKPDIAVANYYSRDLSVLLGNGDGTFQASVNYGVGNYPFSVVVTDFNGNGKLDLAVAIQGSGQNNYTDGSVSVLLNTCGGCPAFDFTLPQAFDVGSGPFSVAAADFNSDGKRDLAVANSGSTNVSVLLGNGDGTFQAALNFSAGPRPYWVASGDFNGDGKPDLAVANSGSTIVSVLLGNGDGTFQTAVNYGTGPVPFSISVSDFNLDGKLDLAVANGDSNYVSVLIGNGDGTFRSAINYDVGTYPYSVAVGDFNRDGKRDLAVANFGSTNVSVLLGNGNGTFQVAVNYGTGVHPWSVAAGDFNNDGKTDLAVANAGSVGVSILLGNGDGTFQTAVSYPAGMGSVALAVSDFNDDGKLDLAVGNISSSNVSVLLGNGDGTFQAAINFGNQLHPQSVAVGDFNADGKPDLALADFTPPGFSGTVSVLLNTCASAGIELTIARSNSNTVTVSWPFPSTGFVLESTTNLSLTNWQRAVELPATNNARLEVTVSADQQERYFRLHKP